MSDRAPTAVSLTRLAVERINEGDVVDARMILAEALGLEPNYEPAWLWFAHIAKDPGELKFALEQAAAANPASVARQELPKLARVTAVMPAEVADFAPPPPPDFAVPTTPVARSVTLPRGRRGLVVALGAIALAVLVTVLLFLGNRGDSPVYVAVVGTADETGDGISREIVASARLLFDQANAAGGIGGHPVEVLVFDDQNDPDRAREIARQIIEDGRALLVIGHRTSSASLAAAPIYAAAGIPAITGTATDDAVTADHPWYFRTVFDNRTQGLLIAAYIRQILGEDHISILGGSDDYGTSLAQWIDEAFAQTGEVRHRFTIDTTGGELETTLAGAVAELQADPDPGTIVLALPSADAIGAVTAIRDAGIAARLFGGDALGSDLFLASLVDQSPSPDTPGFYTDGLMAASPLIMDSLTSETLRWFNAFRQTYLTEPTWRGATTFDAAIAAVAAMRAAGIEGNQQQRAAERQAIRDALAAMNGPDRAVPGLLGPIYFDANRTTPRAEMFGVARDDRYASAYEQLKPYAPSGAATLDDDLANGVAMEVEGQMLQRQRVVFAGINLNEIGELDTANPSFYADFFLWFNYTGDDDATDVVFVNAVDPDLALGEPVRTAVDTGVTYGLYRVSGRFKAPLEFQDFPFDKQHLLISFQHRSLPSSRLVYAVDHELLALPQQQRLQSGTNAAVSINAIPNWQATEVQVYQDTVGSTALLGDPEATVGSSGIEYSVFTEDITVERDVGAFLGKNLLPLALLAIVTYASLFFPYTLTEARVTFGVTGILTAAVLLASVTSVLPQVGYTVAIEWGFYAFIFLSATCIIFGLVGDWLYEQRQLTELRRLDLFSRIYYPAFVLVVVLAYVIRYGART